MQNESIVNENNLEGVVGGKLSQNRKKALIGTGIFFGIVTTIGLASGIFTLIDQKVANGVYVDAILAWGKKHNLL